MEKRFNLIDENWILTNIGRVSLKGVFSNDMIKTVGSTTTEKLCLIKFITAICQAANDFESIDDIADAGVEKVRENVLRYLETHYDEFWFYGDRPFLQFPALAGYDQDRYRVQYVMNSLDENAASGGNGIYVDSQIKNKYNDADKANLLVVNLGAALKSKPKPMNRQGTPIKGERLDAVLSGNDNYVKAATMKKNKLVTGENLCEGIFNNMLHGFVTGNSIMETAFVNILSNDEIDELAEKGHIDSKGVPPWEIDGLNEEHEYARTYYAYLVPMNRFMLFDESVAECRMTEGFQYYNVSGGEIKHNFVLSQPDVFVYVDTENKNDGQSVSDGIPVRPMQEESVIFSMRPYVEANKGSKTNKYNFMINHSKALLTIVFGENKKALRPYGIEFIGTEYQNDKGSTSRKGYVEKRFGFGTKIAQDPDRLNMITSFIGDEKYNLKDPKSNRACAIIELAVSNLKKFYNNYNGSDFCDKKKKSVFRQKCRCLLRDVEERAINQDFDPVAELEMFKKNVHKLVLEEIDLDSPHDRGRKIDAACGGNSGKTIINVL